MTRSWSARSQWRPALMRSTLNRLASMPPPKTGSLLVLLPGGPRDMEGMSANDFLWAIQCRVIRSLAEKEPCVIVGRCADYILREREDCLNVFIHASMAARADRIVRLYGSSEKSPENAWRRRTRGAASTTSTIPTGIGACLRTTTSLWTAESSASSGAWTSSPSWQRHCKKLRRILIFPLTNLQNLIECFLQTE